MSLRSLPEAGDLDLEAGIGQLICPTLIGAQLADHPVVLAEAIEAIGRYGWGGHVVFHSSPEDLGAMLPDLQSVSRVPLLVAADLEHGVGQQVAGGGRWPNAMAFGATDEPAFARAAGVLTAREALAVGINWVLAPVADVSHNPANPIINVRSYGGDASRVAAMVAAFVTGCQETGALACAKHFPGHGDTAVDSHSALATVHATRLHLEEVDWPPFRAAIAADVASIMSAHLAVPALGVPERPATLSRSIMTGVLREHLGFRGLVVTDAMLMRGLGASNAEAEGEKALQALLAGCDMLLMPRDPAGVHQALVAAVHAGRLPRALVDAAVSRVLAAKGRVAWQGPHGSPPPGKAAADLAREVAKRAMTLARGPADWRVPAGWLAIAVDDGAAPEMLAAWQAGLAARGLPARWVVSGAPLVEEEALHAAVVAAEGVLLAIFSPVRVGKDRSLLGPALLATLHELTAGRPLALVSFASPYIACQFPTARVWVLAYGGREAEVAAAQAALWDGAGYPGRLPVELPSRLDAADGEGQGGGIFA